MYEYKCKVVNVVDGDTVDVDIDLGFGIWKCDERIRLMGIDTAESRTRDLVEKSWGLAAKKRLIELTEGSDSVIIRTEKDKAGKYGRILGTLLLEQEVGSMLNINQLLVEEHFAIPYTGQNKDDAKEASGIMEYWGMMYEDWLKTQQ